MKLTKFSRHFVFGGLVLMLPLILSGCRDPRDVSKDLIRSSTAEEKAFQELQAIQGEAGDEVATAYARWSDEVLNMSEYSDELAGMIARKPEQAASYEAEIKSLQSVLDSLLNRSGHLTLQIPSWSWEFIQEQEAEMLNAMDTISRSYVTLFDQSPSAFELVVEIQMDDRLYDTYGDCVAMFSGKRDANCQLGAVEKCTHQTNIDCVKRLIDDHQAFGSLQCTDYYEAQNGNVYSEVAEWLIVGLRACQSTQPIFK